MEWIRKLFIESNTNKIEIKKTNYQLKNYLYNFYMTMFKLNLYCYVSLK